MTKKMNDSPDYGNWVSKNFVIVPGIIGLILLGIAFIFPILSIFSVFFLLIAIYFIYARYLFSPRGKNVQDQIRSLVVSHCEWSGTGKILDIGCGSAALTIELAKKFPDAIIIGIDNWGKSWEYSQQACEKNAQIEGVSHRCSFQNGTASNLSFDDDSFDVVVSNLVFHEVQDAKNKRGLIQEALRVVRKGGIFVFQDLFLLEPYYGKMDDLFQTIHGWGVSEVKYIETHKSSFIPTALKLPFMVGTIGMLVGKK